MSGASSAEGKGGGKGKEGKALQRWVGSGAISVPRCHPRSVGTLPPNLLQLGGGRVVGGAWARSCLVQTSLWLVERVWKLRGRRTITTALTLPGASFAGECRQEGCRPA